MYWNFCGNFKHVGGSRDPTKESDVYHLCSTLRSFIGVFGFFEIEANLEAVVERGLHASPRYRPTMSEIRASIVRSMEVVQERMGREAACRR